MNAVPKMPQQGPQIIPTEDALHLLRANPLLRFSDEVDRKEPLGERKVGVVENRSTSHRKLITAGVAVILGPGIGRRRH